ncbi:MAG: serpin family protein [Saccharofermentanales bacterium]
MKTQMLLNHRQRIAAVLCLILATAMMLGMSACSAAKVQAADLMEGISAGTVSGKETDSRFTAAMADFSIDLFKKTIKEDGNVLVSPLSVMLALAMTTNGAANATLTQMETLLGKDIKIDELNEYLYTYIKNLPAKKDARLNIANSIWFRDEAGRLTVEQDFLQTNADYYSAAAYKSAFDDQTLADINNWVKTKTEGMIEKILEQISDDAVMYLINAIVFDAKWQTVYSLENVSQGEFTAFDGSKKMVDMMRSEEAVYLEDASSTGFIKPYIGGDYSFVALLPNEGIAIDDYIASMTGDSFMSILDGASDTAVAGTLPKFSYDYTVKMNGALKELGMPDAFDAGAADLSRLGKSTRGNLYIGEVLHKTFIQVDELGTKAGAVTKVEVNDESYTETKIVDLNRPFVYAIIDNATKLPVFIGTVLTFD